MQSITLYENEKMILDAAIKAGGGHIDLPTHGKAVQFRQRLYTFRKLFREKHSHTPYDRLTIPKLSEASCRVLIQVKKVEGVFVPAVGAEPLDVRPVIKEGDDLLDVARAIAGDILGND